MQLYSWFVNGAVYFGLTLAAAGGGGTSGGGGGGTSRYLSAALSGLVELPAFALSAALLSRFPRVRTLCGFMLAGGAAVMAVVVTAPVSPVGGEDDCGEER